MKKGDTTAAKFGTLGGVFTPCTLTILGVIMFLRYGQVVGQAGLWHALIILGCAKLITTFTALSLSAVATNTKMRGGGAYFLISRSLGAETGAAIGLVFYLAQAVSVTLYILGFTEALLEAFPQFDGHGQVVATVVNALLAACVFIGAGWTIRLQYGILGLLMLSLVSFFAGAIPQASTATLMASLRPAYEPGSGFFMMFALFFPAVTGVMAGANMSGDLRDPGKSIPTGTLASVAFTGLIYLAMAVCFAAALPQEVLKNDPFVVKKLARWEWLITAGVFAATLSSALGSMMGAPRILQALARDSIIPSLRRFAAGSGASAEPRQAVILTFVIAQAGILFGELDVVAPLITMFFLITYGMLNMACFFESAAHNPSYRPMFRYSHWSTALAGAVGCLVVMFLIAPVWALLALGAMALLYQHLNRAQVQAHWGDVSGGVAFERARRALLTMEDGRYHPKNWRPAILVLMGGTHHRAYLARMGALFTAKHGLLTLAQLITGDVEDRHASRVSALKQMRQFIDEEDIEAFTTVLVGENLLSGTKSLLQCYGIGGFQPNTLLLGMSRDPERMEDFAAILRLARQLEFSVLVACSPRPEDERDALDSKGRQGGSIDIWWGSKRHGALMLLLGHLLQKNEAWRRCPLRVLRQVPQEADVEPARKGITTMLQSARIRVEVKIVVGRADEQTPIREHSSDAAMIFIGFDPPEKGEGREFIESMVVLSEKLPQIVLVSAHEPDVRLEA